MNIPYQTIPYYTISYHRLRTQGCFNSYKTKQTGGKIVRISTDIKLPLSHCPSQKPEVFFSEVKEDREKQKSREELR